MNHSTIQDSYGELKQKLIGIALEASKVITTFALLEEMIELQGQFCFSELELMRYTDEVLVLKCQQLEKKLQEYLPDLTEFGFPDQIAVRLAQTICSFQHVSVQHLAMTELPAITEAVSAES